MLKFRLNNLQLLGIYLVLALGYTLYYLPFLPQTLFYYAYWYGGGFLVSLF